jgi:protein-disulfide isomerase
MKTAALLLMSLAAFAQVKTKPAAAPPPAPSAQKSAFDKATLEAYLRNLELWVPQVEVKIDDAKPSKDLPGFFDVKVHLSYNGGEKEQDYYISQDGKKILRGDVFEINKSPFQANLDKLKIADQPMLGPLPPAIAPISLVVFSDFECPICKEEAQILREQVAKQFADKVRIYFKDFPLDSIHPWAHAAAIAGRCVYNQNPTTFWDYFDWVYENQQGINLDNFNGKFQAFANDHKLDGMQLGRCVENKTSDADVTREIAEGHALQVSATPTSFLNGRKLEGGLPWQTLEQLINIELDHQAKAAQAAAAGDDKCCEVSIPKVGSKK